MLNLGLAYEKFLSCDYMGTKGKCLKIVLISYFKIHTLAHLELMNLMEQLMKRFNSSYELVPCKSEFNFKCKFLQWHFNIYSVISCKLWRSYKKSKVTSKSAYNSKYLFIHSIAISSVLRKRSFCYLPH